MINTNVRCGLNMKLEEVPKTSSVSEHQVSTSFLGLSRAPDVIDLQDHPDHLGSQGDLLLFGDQSLDHVLLLHVFRKEQKQILNTSSRYFGSFLTTTCSYRWCFCVNSQCQGKGCCL